MPFESTRLRALELELRALLGDRAVSTEPAALAKASVDGARLSPILSDKLPLGAADVVVTPATADDAAAVVTACVRHGVAVTPRGKGTGNYGQAIPTHGGLVLDLSRCRRILEVGEGRMTVEAGVTMITLEQAARAAGQQVLMYPSTAQSTVGGFLSGGSGGTGSIAHGLTTSGHFVLALDVVHASGEGVHHVEGEAAQAYLHNYGTAGVILRATIALEPLQPWCALYASFDDLPRAAAALRPLAALHPTPRLVSADPAEIAGALPSDPAIPSDRASFRAIVDAAALAEAEELIREHGGTVEAVRDSPQDTVRLSMISYNHPIEWLQKSSPSRLFHVEVNGHAIVDRLDEVLAVYPGASLHLEAMNPAPLGMLVAPYRDERTVLEGYDRLAALGVRSHSPHQSKVDFEVRRTIDLALRTDPAGLLNPGKLDRVA
ncbi:FAD-binding oxidoreductase [Herbiconiux moechotypicola]|uniref:FAD-binding oxidoreductase n=1 Tax=Herbiconiux moechotypicola TaxID=637393 RepID=A0ABN3DML8_9MICO|nr:FAD-binding oxidoreductase [Herbiconiux moechotypicola]MCS5730099.1 FAD-binding oxidoreductase [Herbiconiux moechotypicola]